MDANTQTIVLTVVLALASYFIGNISPAILIGRMYGIDIKKEGSGNAGTTNVLRVLGKKAAIATLVIDVLKGVLAVLLGRYVVGTEMAAMICGLSAICGHVWPAFFKFKGGKGVATAFGVIVAVNPLLGLSTLIVVLLVVVISRRMSAGSVVGAILFPFIACYFDRSYLYWALALAAIVLFKHRANIVRLLKGEEPKLSFKK